MTKFRSRLRFALCFPAFERMLQAGSGNRSKIRIGGRVEGLGPRIFHLRDNLQAVDQ